MPDVTDTARRAARSDAMEWGARWGLAARAVIYLLMGLLALAVAQGKASNETDQRGALSEVARRPGGTILLVLIAIGFASYALWRLSEAAFGVVGEGKAVGPRLKSGFRGLVYASFAVTTVGILAGSSGSQASQQQAVTAKVMAHTGGRWLVGVVGAIVVVVGATMVFEGVTKRFEKNLRVGQMGEGTRKTVRRLGMVGTVARGLVFGLAGALVVDAAVTYRPQKARGLDGALRTLAAQPYGSVLLTVAALGLVAFGVYGLAESRWHRT